MKTERGPVPQRPVTEKPVMEKPVMQKTVTQKTAHPKLVLQKLTVPEARRIHESYLVRDFPWNEVKPFFVIRNNMRKGRYAVYGAYLSGGTENMGAAEEVSERSVPEGSVPPGSNSAGSNSAGSDPTRNNPSGSNLAGYAFVALSSYGNEAVSLLDYFAVMADKRGKGIGTDLLRMLSPEALGVSRILIEAERVTDGLPWKEKADRERRIRFYERVGAVRTGVHTHLYGVDYDILALARGGETVSEEEVYKLTDHMYHDMYEVSWFPGLARVCRGDGPRQNFGKGT